MRLSRAGRTVLACFRAVTVVRVFPRGQRLRSDGDGGWVMAYRQPWDAVCPCCKARKGLVCRSRITGKSMADKAHESRWNVSLGLRTTPGGNERAMTTRGGQRERTGL